MPALKTIRRPWVVIFITLLVLLVAAIIFQPRSPGLQLSILDVSREGNGPWYATVGLTNELDTLVAFVWLGSEDRDLEDPRAEWLPADDPDDMTFSIGPHQSTTYSLELPRPGTARRFRLRYCSSNQRLFRLRALLHRIGFPDPGLTGCRTVVSPEARVEDGGK